MSKARIKGRAVNAVSFAEGMSKENDRGAVAFRATPYPNKKLRTSQLENHQSQADADLKKVSKLVVSSFEIPCCVLLSTDSKVAHLVPSLSLSTLAAILRSIQKQ